MFDMYMLYMYMLHVHVHFTTATELETQVLPHSHLDTHTLYTRQNTQTESQPTQVAFWKLLLRGTTHSQHCGPARGRAAPIHTVTRAAFSYIVQLDSLYSVRSIGVSSTLISPVVRPVRPGAFCTHVFPPSSPRCASHRRSRRSSQSGAGRSRSQRAPALSHCWRYHPAAAQAASQAAGAWQHRCRHALRGRG